MVQLLQNLADEFAAFAQGMVRGNPLLRMNVRKHPALILRPSAHLQSSRRIRGGLNHHSFALARFFSKLLERIMRETRRRPRVVGAFPDGKSCLTLAAARLRYIAGSAWSAKRYMNMRPLSQMQFNQTGAVA